jgi:Spy/CpxP family protein refolding chaperone
MISLCYQRLLAFAFVLLVSTAAASAQQQLNWFWWKMEPSLALTADQSAQIDAIFKEGIAQLQLQKTELDRQESKLSGMIASMTEEAQVVRQIDRVEGVRSSLNKTRTLMLLHMRQILTPEQRTRLNALRDRREEERRQRERDRQRLSEESDKRSDGQRKRSN